MNTNLNTNYYSQNNSDHIQRKIIDRINQIESIIKDHNLKNRRIITEVNICILQKMEPEIKKILISNNAIEIYKNDYTTIDILFNYKVYGLTKTQLKYLTSDGAVALYKYEYNLFDLSQLNVNLLQDITSSVDYLTPTQLSSMINGENNYKNIRNKKVYNKVCPERLNRHFKPLPESILEDANE